MSSYEMFRRRGITLHHPATLALDVKPEQIAAGVEIFPGCRISGEHTYVGPGCRIGREGPATIQDCQLGAKVSFASGFAQQATLLDGVTIGANAHIRPGTLLEEQVTLGHCVGLKQTLLLPFVTLGSLINFCDCLMAGGTSRSHHSEVGSSFVHFNFTPRGDKATPSLFGDVPRGVLLDQPPIFLGGQGGAVGPLRMAYGTIQAAGSICRKDVLSPHMLIRPVPPTIPPGASFDPARFGNLERIVRHNCIYIGNLHALAAWYQCVRMTTTATDPYAQACWRGAKERLQQMVTERVRQLTKLAERVAGAPDPHPCHKRLLQFLDEHTLALPDTFGGPPTVLSDYLAAAQQPSHIACLQAMPPAVKTAARDWLQAVVDHEQEKWEQTANGHTLWN